MYGAAASALVPERDDGHDGDEQRGSESHLNVTAATRASHAEGLVVGGAQAGRQLASRGELLQLTLDDFQILAKFLGRLVALGAIFFERLTDDCFEAHRNT